MGSFKKITNGGYILMKPFKSFNTRFLYISLVFFVCIISSCGEEPEGGGKSLLEPAYLLPTDDEISGWKTLGAYEEANDYDSLYAVIDGGAEIFIDNGFVSAAFQIYQNCIGGICKGPFLHIRIYDQGNETNAKATYEKLSTGISIPWVTTDAEARIDESGLASYAVELWKKNFYVQVVIEEKSSESLNIAKLFASHISKKIR